MSNSDYYSRLDRLDGLEARNTRPRYRAVIDIQPKPTPVLAPSWSPIRFAILLVVVALAVIAITGALISKAVLT